MSVETILKNDERAVFALRELYRQYGYLPYKMSRFEEYDLYVQNKDFLVSDQVITFSDRNGRLLALKPDVTLSIIKNVPDQAGTVRKVYYNENVYRADKSTHVFKEIMQAGLECVGDLGAYEIAEVVLLAAKSLSRIADSFLLDISHMGLLSAVLDACKLSEKGKLRAMTCLRQKNSHELLALCREEGCDAASTETLCALCTSCGKPAMVLPTIQKLITSEAASKALSELTQICELLAGQGFEDTVRIDFSVGSDMTYYSGVVFKGYLEGVPTGILSGGQYDKLLRKMGRSSSAIGFAIYLDLLERLGHCTAGFDVDTVLLHDAKATIAQITEASEALRKNGSVLAVSQRPKGYTWRRLYALQNGEAVLLEDNG